MVKIIDLEDDLVNQEVAENTDNDTTDEEDDGIEVDMEEKPPDPPEPPGPPMPQAASSAEEQSVPEVVAGPSLAPESSRHRPLGPGIIPPSLRVGPTRYLWDVIAHYGHYVEFQRSLQDNGPIRADALDDLNRRALGFQQRACPSNGHGNPEFFCSIRTPDTDNTISVMSYTNSDMANTSDSSTENSEDKKNVERLADNTVIGTAPTNDEVMHNEEEKSDSEESTKEKSNGVGEKEQLAAATAAAKSGLLSSPELSDYELSDASDSHAPPDYDTLQAELNTEYTSNQDIVCTTTSLTQCPWTTIREPCPEDPDPQLLDATDGKALSETSEEGEAACLPAPSVVKDCWEQWIDDDRLFTLAEDVQLPSTSAGARMPSPASPMTERRQTKLENRQRARERERASKQVSPISRQIFVPTEKIGRILGKGGRKIREIEKNSGAKITVVHRRSSQPVSQLTLIGSDAQISKADEEISLIIRNYKPPKGSEATSSSVNTSSEQNSELKELLIGIKNQVIDAEKRSRKS